LVQRVPSPLLAVLNVTAHPPEASVPITVLLYDGPLLCGFNVAIEVKTKLCKLLGRVCRLCYVVPTIGHTGCS